MIVRPFRLRVAALAVLLPTLGGCYYFAGAAIAGATLGAASTPRSLPLSGRYPAGAALMIDFASRPDIAAALPGGRDSLRVEGVSRIVGRLQSTRGDTMFVAITELRRAQGGPMAFANRHEPVMEILPETPARIHVIASNGRLAERVVWGALAGMALSLLLIYLACTPEGCYSD